MINVSGLPYVRWPEWLPEKQKSCNCANSSRTGPNKHLYTRLFDLHGRYKGQENDNKTLTNKLNHQNQKIKDLSSIVHNLIDEVKSLKKPAFSNQINQTGIKLEMEEDIGCSLKQFLKTKSRHLQPEQDFGIKDKGLKSLEDRKIEQFLKLEVEHQGGSNSIYQKWRDFTGKKEQAKARQVIDKNAEIMKDYILMNRDPKIFAKTDAKELAFITYLDELLQRTNFGNTRKLVERSTSSRDLQIQIKADLKELLNADSNNKRGEILREKGKHTDALKLKIYKLNELGSDLNPMCLNNVDPHASFAQKGIEYQEKAKFIKDMDTGVLPEVRSLYKIEHREKFQAFIKTLHLHIERQSRKLKVLNRAIRKTGKPFNLPNKNEEIDKKRVKQHIHRLIKKYWRNPLNKSRVQKKLTERYKVSMGADFFNDSDIKVDYQDMETLFKNQDFDQLRQVQNQNCFMNSDMPTRYIENDEYLSIEESYLDDEGESELLQEIAEG